MAARAGAERVDPVGQPAAAGHRTQPALDLAAHRLGGHDDQVVADPQRGARPGTKASPPRTTSVTAAPGGRRSSKTSTPASREPSVDVHLQQVGVQPGQRRRLDVQLLRLALGRRRPACAPPTAGSAPAPAVKTTTSTNTRLKIVLVAGHRREHDRHRAAQPGPGQEHRSLGRRDARTSGSWNGSSDRNTDSGRATSSSTRPMPRAGRIDGPSSAGRREQPEHHEQPDLGQPAHALDEAAGRRAVRQPGVAQHQPRRGRPRGSRCACATAAAPYAVTHSASTASGYRPDEGSAIRRTPHAPSHPTASPTTAAERQLVDRCSSSSSHQDGAECPGAAPRRG